MPEAFWNIGLLVINELEDTLQELQNFKVNGAITVKYYIVSYYPEFSDDSELPIGEMREYQCLGADVEFDKELSVNVCLLIYCANHQS